MSDKTTCSFDKAKATLKRSLHEAFFWSVVKLSGSSTERIDEVGRVAKQVGRSNQLEDVCLQVRSVVVLEQLLDD